MINNKQIYDGFVESVKEYFRQNPEELTTEQFWYLDADIEKRTEYVMLHGGCFWFAWKLSSMIPEAKLMYHPVNNHCALWFDGKLYDFSRELDMSGFREPEGEEHMYLYNHFAPRFDAKKLSVFVEGQMEKGGLFSY